MSFTKEIWDKHYKKNNANLLIPDENVVRFFSRLRPGNVLDFGCGSGRNAIHLANNAFNPYFLDYSPKAIKLSKTNSSKINLPKALNRFYVFTADHYPYANSFFDYILAWGVLHYNQTNTILEILNNFKRLLKPSGILFLSLRTIKESYLQHKNNVIISGDLDGAKIYTYNLKDARALFTNFKNLQIGYIERTEIGDMSKCISHWVISCEN